MHKPIKYVEKVFTYVAKGAWVVFDKLNSVQPEAFDHAEVGGQAAAEVVSEDQAATGLAADDRFALPQVRAGDPAADCGRQAAV